ncbi:hypothetical protein ACF0H5_018372 [Mactra antiquata]
MAAVNNFTFMMIAPMLDFGGSNLTLEDNASSTPKSLFYTIPGPIICVFGMVCNVLNLCVLSQNILKDSPYTYLTALALSDLSFLTVSFFHLACTKTNGSYAKAFFDIYIFFSVGNIFFNISVWLVVILTIERMLFVIRPLKFRPSKSKAKIWIIVVFVLCSLINVPRFFCYRVRTIRNGFYPKSTPFKMSREFYNVSWFHAMVISFLPFFIILVTNSVLIFGLHRAKRERMSLHSNQEHANRKDQVRLTRTLVAVVVVFFVCTIPSAFVDDPIAFTIFGNGRKWREYIRAPDNQLLVYISNLLLFVNSSMNFILYCSFNKKFRLAMKIFLENVHVYKSRTPLGGKSVNTCACVLKKTMMTKV